MYDTGLNLYCGSCSLSIDCVIKTGGFLTFTDLADNCPMLHIPGRTFPVKEYQLEDVVEMIR